MKLILSICLVIFMANINLFADANNDLIVACRAGNLDNVKKAIQAGADVNCLDEQGNTPLTAGFFWPDIEKFLLDNKANPNLGNTTPLFQACCNYSVEVVKILLDAGADPNLPNKTDPTAIYKKLIDDEKAKGKGANKNMIKAYENMMKEAKITQTFILPTLIMGTNCVPCLKMMLEKGAKVDLGVNDGNLIHTLAGYGNSKEIRKTGFASIKPTYAAFGLAVPNWILDLQDDRNGTPEEMLKLLLSKGIDINAKNKGTSGIPPQTPLEVSLGGGLLQKPEVSLALIKNGADVKLDHKWYGPVILQAAQLGSPEVLSEMINKGADINTEGPAFTDSDNGAQIKNFTPLTCAAMKNHLEAVKLLIDKGAKNEGISGSIVNGGCPGKLENKSAIFFAIEHQNIEMIKYIVEHNAFNGKKLTIKAQKFTNCVGGASYTPSKYAKELKASEEIINYLSSKGI